MGLYGDSAPLFSLNSMNAFWIFQLTFQRIHIEQLNHLVAWLYSFYFVYVECKFHFNI